MEGNNNWKYLIKEETVSGLTTLLLDIKNNHNQDELIEKIKDLETQISKLQKTKKYWLVWEMEKEPEQIVLDCQRKLPILKEVKDKFLKSDESWKANILIEWDNFHALQVLNYTHKESIDLIYIDPPYNTWNANEWKYNDKYIDDNDTYRHSKWLNFMSKRLTLSKELLKENWLIFISIDDNEQAQLKLLCDEIFWSDNFIANIIWQSKTWSSDAKGIDTITEYILVYAKNKLLPEFTKNADWYDKKRYKLRDEYFSERWPYYLDNLDRWWLRYHDSLNYAISIPDWSSIFPNWRSEFLNDGWTWKWWRQKVKWWLENGYIIFKKSKSKNNWWWVYYKNYLYSDNEGNLLERWTPHKNVISNLKTWDGASSIKNIFWFHVFKYSKPTELIKYFIKSVNLPKDAIILDYFAWSWTTWHSVLELNKEYWLDLKFIICTNNEWNICEEVTFERIKKVSKGYSNDKWAKTEWLGWNLKYYKTDFVEVENVQLIDDKQKLELTYKAWEVIAIKEWTYHEISKTPYFQFFENNKKLVWIYFIESSKWMDQFKNTLKQLSKSKNESVIYIFSYSEPEYSCKDFNVPNLRIEWIPEPILKIYKELNKKI
ncbi:MAG: Methyltransferase [uncultured bacterium (gcode 4)]|uniref:Methyltransferase n=1 Tax=uncultured bacterium (gcode 4) TaxID=1234023 RepID=K2GXP6_9BACT|nr:MAG: Methyltransferase [uncultured bacterium (gcode 4)]